ncbi:hypothetical protein J1N35_014896 [Gossypium stocksii]|uniref:Uncharacterized protein n=1 Tax=Gossypium stocksii TaxID=47602 RepID=A0A9D3VUY2_9ROSI|nr:hypothetical protein J1N35_014896 [Gossypium stocksii]
MPPRKIKKAIVHQTQVVSNLEKFKNIETEKYFLELQSQPLIQERGNQEIRKRINWDSITVRSEEVPTTSKELCEFYNAHFYDKDFFSGTGINEFENIDMEDVIKYLTQGRGTWNYRLDMELPTNFNQAIIFSVAKIWM